MYIFRFFFTLQPQKTAVSEQNNPLKPVHRMDLAAPTKLPVCFA
jgi:hypothetical protein